MRNSFMNVSPLILAHESSKNDKETEGEGEARVETQKRCNPDTKIRGLKSFTKTSGSSTALLRSLVRVVDWFESRLVRLICCRIILTASSPGRLLICRSLAISLLVLPALRTGRVR